MRTVQEIFDEAIHLIDAQNEQTGSTATTDTKEYEVRAAKLLSTLLNEAYPYSDTYAERPEAWAEGESYGEGDKVTYGNGKYVCLVDGTTAAPTDAAAWLRVGTLVRGKRPVHAPVTALTDRVDMDDFICLSALPAGLAALFVFDEDQNKYNAFWGDYMNRLAQARDTLPAADGFEDIENPYSFQGFGAGIEYGEFSRW